MTDVCAGAAGSSNSSRLAQIVEEYLQQVARSGDADAVQFAERYPELPELRSELEKARRVREAVYLALVAESAGFRDIGSGPVPTMIGRFRIIAPLGSGSQAEVFRAYDDVFKRDVVIKWAWPGLSPRWMHKSTQEARDLNRVAHRGVLRVYEAGEHEGRFFLVTEWTGGDTLDRPVQRQAYCRPRPAARLVARLAKTLSFVHQQGVRHLDLKPSNILVDATGQPRILDFGLASSPEDQPESGPGSRAVEGTPEYMAPEQATGDTTVIGPAADVFALGAVLYELLTGQRVYGEVNRHSADLARHLREQAARIAPPRRAARQRVPWLLDRICTRCLSPAVEKRPTAGILWWWLMAYLWWLPVVTGVAFPVLLGAGVWGLRPNLPLTAEFTVRVWSADDKGPKKGGSVRDEGAVPVYNGERVRLEARLNQPAYGYLFWIGADGQTTALYPWPPGADFRAQTLVLPGPIKIIQVPDREAHGFGVTGASGMETALLLVRRTPLPAAVNWRELLPDLPAAPNLSPPYTYTVELGCDGQWITHVPVPGPDRQTRSLDVTEPEGQKLADPLLHALRKLQPHFEVIQAVRFAHTEE